MLIFENFLAQKSVSLKKILLNIIMASILLLPSLTAGVFNSRLAQANVITKTYYDVKLSSLNIKITSNKSKHLLVENELKKLKTFDWSYFIDKSHFEEDITQNYLVFHPMYRYFKVVAGVGNDSYIYYWKSKGFSTKN